MPFGGLLTAGIMGGSTLLGGFLGGSKGTGIAPQAQGGVQAQSDLMRQIADFFQSNIGPRMSGYQDAFQQGNLGAMSMLGQNQGKTDTAFDQSGALVDQAFKGAQDSKSQFGDIFGKLQDLFSQNSKFYDSQAPSMVAQQTADLYKKLSGDNNSSMFRNGFGFAPSGMQAGQDQANKKNTADSAFTNLFNVKQTGIKTGTDIASAMGTTATQGNSIFTDFLKAMGGGISGELAASGQNSDNASAISKIASVFNPTSNVAPFVPGQISGAGPQQPAQSGWPAALNGLSSWAGSSSGQTTLKGL